MTPSKDFKTLIVLGKSGSGKGTQVAMLARDYNFRIISSGTLLRARAEQSDFVGQRIGEIINKGGLVPTPVIFHLWLHELETIRADELLRGVVFEGSPRKLYEAWMLDETLWFYGLEQHMQVVHLHISDEEAMKRLLARGRKDDQPEAIQERLRWYQEQVSPAIEYYRGKGKLIEVHGEQSIEDVYREVLEKLKGFLA